MISTFYGSAVNVSALCRHCLTFTHSHDKLHEMFIHKCSILCPTLLCHLYFCLPHFTNAPFTLFPHPGIVPSFPYHGHLCMRRQANVFYFTQQKLYVGDLAKLIFHTNRFPVLMQPTPSIWQPFIFLVFSFSLGDKQRWDWQGYDLTSYMSRHRQEECMRVHVFA